MSNNLEGKHDWQKDLLRRMSDETVLLTDLAYFLRLSRERPRQMLTQEYEDPAAEAAARESLEAALAWALEHRPPGARVCLGHVVNNCEVTDNSTYKPMLRCLECGNEWRSQGNQAVLSGRAHCTNCTAWVAEDLTGRKFGEWEVLGFVRYSIGDTWTCRCSCGTISNVLGSNLVKGVTKGCRKCGYKQRIRRAQGALVRIYKRGEGEEGEDDA